MGIMKNMVFLIMLIICPAEMFGDDKTAIYNAYISNDLQSWKTVIDRLQMQEEKSNEKLLALVNYQYGYIGWCIGKENDEEAETYIAIARGNLAVLEKSYYNMSMVNTYKSALYGYEIGLSMVRAPFIGPKSMRCAEQALKLDPANPFACMQMGYIQYYMPSIFGGSVSEAIRYFLKAKSGMERDRNALSHDWNYLHLLTLIAQAYADSGDMVLARSYYETLLKIEPRFLWIKDELYPQLSKQFEN